MCLPNVTAGSLNLRLRSLLDTFLLSSTERYSDKVMQGWLEYQIHLSLFSWSSDTADSLTLNKQDAHLSVLRFILWKWKIRIKKFCIITCLIPWLYPTVNNSENADRVCMQIFPKKGLNLRFMKTFFYSWILLGERMKKCFARSRLRQECCNCEVCFSNKSQGMWNILIPQNTFIIHVRRKKMGVSETFCSNPRQ